jgi:hypothetical protein
MVLVWIEFGHWELALDLLGGSSTQPHFRAMFLGHKELDSPALSPLMLPF